MAKQRPFPVHLVDPPTVAALKVRRNGPAALRLALQVAALFLTGWLIQITRGTGWVALPVLAHGGVLVFLFAPLHETIHDTAFRSRALNRLSATLIGYVLLIPAAWFRHFHMAHHRSTNQPGDPELSELRITTLWRYLLQVSGLPLWRERVVTLLRHATGSVDEAYVPPNRRVAVTAEAWSFVALYTALGGATALTGTWDDLLWLWIVPLLVGQQRGAATRLRPPSFEGRRRADRVPTVARGNDHPEDWTTARCLPLATSPARITPRSSAPGQAISFSLRRQSTTAFARRRDGLRTPRTLRTRKRRSARCGRAKPNRCRST